MAERYKGLGLSVRQGQKVKDALAVQSQIQEDLQATSKGKLRVIRLTEQARLLLDFHGNEPSQAN